MKGKVFLIVNQSSDSINAIKIIEKANINHVTILTEDEYQTMPKVIYNGVTYKGASGIRNFVGMSKIFPPKQIEDEVSID